MAVPSASESARLDAFRALSAKLTGFALEDMNAGFAADLLAALLEAGHGTGIQALLSGQQDSAAAALETAIASAWYSGVLPFPSGPVAGALGGALVWRAANFASPPGICDGTDSWAAPAEALEAGQAGQALPPEQRAAQK